MTGAEYVAEFLHQRGIRNVFLVTGGACAFIIDAIGRNPNLKYQCFQHEQSAAMAADAIWRTNRIVGATVVTSGPGATNLITGIACSYFDSIPTLHITGQVNQNEKQNYQGANVRQAGFQETKIVEMVRPITKYAVQVTTGKELKVELEKAYNLAITGRMGPVLIDIPMDVQKAEVGDAIEYKAPAPKMPAVAQIKTVADEINRFFAGAERPLVLAGAGIGLANAEKDVFKWIAATGIPFVTSWNGATYFDHDMVQYAGTIGVYGNRGANFLVQNCDRLLVLGSRLDNRQRSGATKEFACSANVHVLDVDHEELMKYKNNTNYSWSEIDLQGFGQVAAQINKPRISEAWIYFFHKMKERYYGHYPSQSAKKHGSLSPYEVIQAISKMVNPDAIVPVDTGALLCWVFQSFHRKAQTLFTAGGNSPMGYSLPAAIGAALFNPKQQVICFAGDGGMQMNIQELQTLKHHDLNVKVIVGNNFGYGIIKQFQELYFKGRYHATGNGYSVPDFGKVAEGYGIAYKKVEKVSDLSEDLFQRKGPMIVEVVFHPLTQTEPKLELGRSIEDQFPYLSDEEYAEGMIFSTKKRVKNPKMND